MSSPAASSHSTPGPTNSSADLEAHLDNEIARVTREIANIRKQQQEISSALLASTNVQTIVQTWSRTASDRDSASEVDVYTQLEHAIAKQQARCDIQVHRLVNHVTAFPFKHPAPERIAEGAMLGLRFEMPQGLVSNAAQDEDQTANKRSTDGMHTTGTDGPETFLVVLRRIQHRSKVYLQLQPDMNQIPKHIDVEGFAAVHLPIPDEAILDNENGDRERRSPSELRSESFQDDSGIDVTQDLTQVVNNEQQQLHGNTNSTAIPTVPKQTPNTIITNIQNNGQNLHLFVQVTRNAILSWHYRRTYISHLQSSLLLIQKPISHRSPNTTSKLPTPPSLKYNHHITHLSPSNPAATQLQIDWSNKTTALLGLNEAGYVTIARAFGPKMFGTDEGTGVQGSWRCHEIERRLVGDDDDGRGGMLGIWDVKGRLVEIGELIGRVRGMENGEFGGDVEMDG